jgi:hypothetical protein
MTAILNSFPLKRRFNKVLISTLILLLPKFGFTQTQSDVNNAWHNLSNILKDKTLAGKNICIIAMDSKAIKRDDIDNGQFYASALLQRLKYASISDSMTIQSIYNTYEKLDTAIKNLIDQIDLDRNFRLLNSYKYFRNSYLELNNKLNVSTKDFNDLCISLKRPDLIRSKTVTAEISFD